MYLYVKTQPNGYAWVSAASYETDEGIKANIASGALRCFRNIGWITEELIYSETAPETWTWVVLDQE